MLKRTVSVVIVLSMSVVMGADRLEAQSALLEKHLLLSGDRIGMVQGIDVDRKGQIYVGDLINCTVHLFSENGKYIRAIGKRGRGPTEFSGVWNTMLIGKDSLCVFDGQSFRVMVFSPERFEYPAYTISLPAAPDGYMPTVMGTTETGFEGMWFLSEKKYLVVPYATGYSEKNLQKISHLRLYLIDRNGRFVKEKPILTVQEKQRLVISGRGGFSVSEMPYGRRPIIHVGQDDKVYYGDTDSLRIKVLDLNSQLLRTIELPTKRVKLTRQMWERQLRRWPDKNLTMAVLERSAQPMPQYAPVFEALLTDDKGRLWIGLNTEDPDSLEWWILGSDGKRVTSFHHSKDAVIKLVRGDRAYGIYTDDNGIQSIVRYRINQGRF